MSGIQQRLRFASDCARGLDTGVERGVTCRAHCAPSTPHCAPGTLHYVHDTEPANPTHRTHSACPTDGVCVCGGGGGGGLS